MPVRPEIAERYEDLDAKPDELTWEGIDAFAAEMAQAYGGRSLEYAHALSLYARKARWTSTERERARAAMDLALSIVGSDLRVPNQIWWRHLQCLICHDLGDGEAAIRYAREMQEWTNKSSYETASLKYYQGIVYALEAWTQPAFQTLRNLGTIWKAIEEKNRKELRKLVNEIADRRAGLRPEEKAMYAAITTEEAGLTAAMANATPESNPEALKAALADLDALTGLHAVKAQVRRLVAQLRMREQRKEAGLPLPDVTNHMAFLGPPGTGKTTVARLLGRIFCALGLLPSDNLVETDRAGLVAQYVGQTAPKVHAKVDEAMGGVLFIDEAYMLAPTSGNDFGHEAVAALLKRMEDDRHKLVVVLAGYDEEMQTLFDSNPGLRSRVPTQLNFRAYSGSELHAIFASMLRHQGFALSPAAAARAGEICGLIRSASDARAFGNAREVRNIVEDTIAAQAERLSAQLDRGERVDKETLTRIEDGDVTWVELGDPALDHLDPSVAELVAVHEAGHALVRRVCGASNPVLVTIIPSPGALGRTFFQADERGVLFRRDLLAMAAAALGGRAAEEEVYGEASAGAIGDLAAAERIVRSAIRSGLSESASDQAIREFALSGITNDAASAAARNDVAELLAEAWTVARNAVREHRAQLDALTDALLHHRSVQGDALLALLPPAPAVVPLRRQPSLGGPA